MAQIFRRAEEVPPIVEDAIAIRAKVVWMQPGIVNEEAAARAEVASDPAEYTLLSKRIPADVIHSLIADLHLCIRKADNRITVITADGRDWVLRAPA